MGYVRFERKRPQNVQGKDGGLLGSNLVNHRQTSELWNIHGEEEKKKKKKRRSNEGQHETVDGVAKEKKKEEGRGGERRRLLCTGC